jgi:PPOX class probable F420-dependent enzyme
MVTPHELSALADETYVSLTTFRKSGAGVATPNWIVADGERLLVTTVPISGKVKRIRHSIRVELTPCDMRGFVAEGALSVTATATVLNDEETLNAVDVALKKSMAPSTERSVSPQKYAGPPAIHIPRINQ